MAHGASIGPPRSKWPTIAEPSLPPLVQLPAFYAGRASRRLPVVESMFDLLWSQWAAMRVLSSHTAPWAKPCYSKRVPAAEAHAVPVTLSEISRISTADFVTKASPLAASSNSEVTFCEPMKAPLEL